MNIAEIYDIHYLPEKSKKRRASTVNGYDSSVRKHVLPRWGACEIEDIDPDDLQAWVDGFALAGAAEKAFKCLRQIIRWWVKAKRLRAFDPTVYVELPAKAPPSTRRSWWRCSAVSGATTLRPSCSSRRRSDRGAGRRAP